VFFGKTGLFQNLILDEAASHTKGFSFYEKIPIIAM
jgi:hypothetical protein